MSQPRHLTPRKRPIQARSNVTVDAIFEATIQVLLADGPHRLTTTRVAQRAGVSVGTLYQYYPHKQALLYALNERYLDALAARIEATCRAQHGASVAEMVEALVTTYWRAKTERADVTRALYRSVAELDTETLVAAFASRADAATGAMFASAVDAAFGDPATVNLMLVMAIFGTVRNIFERDLPPAEAEKLYRQLVAMCSAYASSAT